LLERADGEGVPQVVDARPWPTGPAPQTD
jgi:hypothetical protein